MNGSEAAVVIGDYCDEQLPLCGKIDSQISHAIIARRWAANEIARRCARSNENPITIVDIFIKEIEGYLKCYNRRTQEASYERFAQALTAAIDIREIFTETGRFVDMYHERRGLV